MIQEEQSRQIGYLVIQGQELTLRKLHQAIELAIKNSVNSYKNRSGKVSLRKLRTSRNQIRVIGTEDSLDGFRKYCKKYGVRYSLIQDESNVNQNLLLFEAKNEELIQQCLKEFYKDFDKEINLEESIDLEEFLESEELIVDKNKLKKNKQLSLNEKLDQYIDQDQKDKTKQVVRSIPEREGR